MVPFNIQSSVHFYIVGLDEMKCILCEIFLDRRIIAVTMFVQFFLVILNKIMTSIIILKKMVGV